MKNIQIMPVGGLAACSPQQLQKRLRDEGFKFIGKRFVKKNLEALSKIWKKKKKKRKMEFLLTGRAGKSKGRIKQPFWYEMVRVVKTRAGYQAEFAFSETISSSDLFIFEKNIPKPQKVLTSAGPSPE